MIGLFSAGFLSIVVSVLIFIAFLRKTKAREEEEDDTNDGSVNNEFERSSR